MSSLDDKAQLLTQAKNPEQAAVLKQEISQLENDYERAQAPLYGLLYDLAKVYQDTGDMNLAYSTFLEVYGINTNYRDVVERVRDLEEARKNSRESVH